MRRVDRFGTSFGTSFGTMVTRLVARHRLLFLVAASAVRACDVDCGDEEDLMRMTLLQMSLTMPRGEATRTESASTQRHVFNLQQEPAMVKLNAFDEHQEQCIQNG